MGKAEAPAGVCRDLRKSWKEGAERGIGEAGESLLTKQLHHPGRAPCPPWDSVPSLPGKGLRGSGDLRTPSLCRLAMWPFSPPLCRAVCSQRTEPSPRAVRDEPGPPDSLGIPTAPAGLRRSEIALHGGGWVAVVCRQH